MRGNTTISQRNERTTGRRNERIRRGDARTSWHGERTRGWHKERTARGDATTSWHDKTTKEWRNDKTTRGDATTSWHNKKTRGRCNKRQHNLVVFRVQMKLTGVEAAMVIACIESKPEQLGVR